MGQVQTKQHYRLNFCDIRRKWLDTFANQDFIKEGKLRTTKMEDGNANNYDDVINVTLYENCKERGALPKSQDNSDDQKQSN